MCKNHGILYWICLILVIIGGLNWGLIGIVNFNLVHLIFGNMTFITRLVYILIGLAAVYLIYLAYKIHQEPKVQE